MELKFLGRGSAFNVFEGNNSAFFFDDNELFLIDCGESSFARMIENQILQNVKSINIFITHLHSDHVGSLGTMIAYCYYRLGKIVNIILPHEPKYLHDLNNYLAIGGVTKEMLNYVDETKLDNKYSAFDSVRFVPTKHAKNLDCYGIKFNTKQGLIYYSGDTYESELVKTIAATPNLLALYVDTTTDDYPGNVHLNINLLNSIIPEEVKHKVFCMHINSNECATLAKQMGFNVVKNETPLLYFDKKSC